MKNIIRIVIYLTFLFAGTNPLQAQWVQVSGSYGGQTQCIVVNNTSIIAGTANGIFHSTDGGTNWIAANSGSIASVTSFAMNGTDVFAGTKNAGVFRSTNNGLDWSAVNIGMANTSVTALTFDSTNLIAGTLDGVFLSTNNGTNWNLIDSTNLKSIRAFLVTTNNTGSRSLLGASDAGIFRSTDHGMSWVRIVQGGIYYDLITDSFIDRRFYSLAVNDSTLFAGLWSEVLRSTDFGVSWTSVYKLPIQSANPFYCIAVNKSNVFINDGVDVFCSTNNGSDWTTVSNGLPRNAYGAQTIYSFALKDSTLFAGTYAGVLKTSDNGIHWIPLVNGLNASSSNSLAASGSNVFASFGGGYFLCRSTDNGSNWTVLNDTVYYRFRSLAVNGSYVITGTDGPIIYSGRSSALRSSDNGASWTTISNSLTPYTAHSFGINDTYSFCGYPYANIGVYRCHRDSTSWIGMNNGLPPGVSILLTYGSNLYAGTLQNGIYYSPDNGANWIALKNGIDTAHSLFSTIAVSGSNIFAGTYKNDNLASSIYTPKGILRSTDNGTSWAAVNNGLPLKNVLDVVVSGSTVLASTDSNGVFLSRNNGASWIPFNDGLPNPFIFSLAVNKSFAYAGLLGGIWRRPLSELVDVREPQDQIPRSFLLNQNFPNPFNPSTVISYQLPVVSIVNLAVYDMLGRKIAVLVDHKQSAGTHNVQWNAEGLPSGVYYYRLQSDTFTQTKKLVLMK